MVLVRRNLRALAVCALALSLCAMTAAQAKKIKVACVGDSITYGYTIEDREHKSYPAQLAAMLGDKYEVTNFGVSATTMLKKGDYVYWERPEYNASHEFAPDVVVLMLGTNDSKPQNWEHKAEFEADYKAMIASFRKLPSHPRVILCLPAPAFKGNWGITEEVTRHEVAPIVAKIAKEMKLELIDMHDRLVGHPEMFADQIHPNAAGAAIMAQAVYAQLKKK